MRSLKHFAKIIICTLSLFSAFAFAQDRYGVLAYHSVVDESAAENQKHYFPQTISESITAKIKLLILLNITTPQKRQAWNSVRI